MKTGPGLKAAPLLEWGVEAVTQPGQPKCGDAHVVKLFAKGALVGVVDGCGHGAEAASAAGLAVATLRRNARQDLVTLVRCCHQQLRGTRGAVMSLASFDAERGTMSWLGVGNVEAVLLQARGRGRLEQKTILLRPGVVGYKLPPLNTMLVPVVSGDLLILATDGIQSGFADGLATRESPPQIARRICSRYDKATDDGLVLVARYLGLPGAGEPGRRIAEMLQGGVL